MSDCTDERGRPLGPVVRQLEQRLAEAEASIKRLLKDEEWLKLQLGKHSRKVLDLSDALMKAADDIETDCGGREDLRESAAQMYRAIASDISETTGWERYGKDR